MNQKRTGEIMSTIQAIRSNGNYTVVTWGKEGQAYILQGNLTKEPGKTMLDSHDNFSALIANVTSHGVVYINNASGDASSRKNVAIRELEKVLSPD